MDRLISLQAAIDALCENCDNAQAVCPHYPCKQYTAIEALPSAQQEHLTDDDFETIRIHLSAFRERLCNQHRWKEAEEYQRIIDRFMSFASAQPETQWIPCSKEPDTDRNVFIARGTHDNMTACIGHYDHDYKQWYEDRNWFAKCLYDGLYWCEMPTLPEPYKEEQ